MSKARTSRARKPKAKPEKISLRDRSFRGARSVRAIFDAAETTTDNSRYWAAADALSPDMAVTEWVRRTIRIRARYEMANNSYCKGMALTLANDTIGTGPKLQMRTPNDTANAQVEAAFTAWAREVRLAEKLRAMRIARLQDGEVFAVFTTNSRLRGPVKLDLKLVEADRVASPDWAGTLVIPDRLGNTDDGAEIPESVDGIVYDGDGNPVEYHILKTYPMGGSFAPEPNSFDRLPWDQVIHSFRADRPGQRRGVCEIAPALSLYAQLRRYTLAVLAAAETAADFAGVLESDQLPDGTAADIEPMETLDIERRMMLTVPAGWKMNQVKAEQPTTTYGEFKREIINEIARCLNMPFNVAAGNSATYNYASGRLDHQVYFKSIDVDRSTIEAVEVDPCFSKWLDEAVLVSGFLPQSLRGIDSDRTHQWFWDGREHVDPAKEATATATDLHNHATSLSRVYAKQGLDWESELRQIARERALKDELGIPEPDAPGAPTFNDVVQPA